MSRRLQLIYSSIADRFTRFGITPFEITLRQIPWNSRWKILPNGSETASQSASRLAQFCGHERLTSSKTKNEYLNASIFIPKDVYDDHVTLEFDKR